MVLGIFTIGNRIRHIGEQPYNSLLLWILIFPLINTIISPCCSGYTILTYSNAHIQIFLLYCSLILFLWKSIASVTRLYSLEHNQFLYFYSFIFSGLLRFPWILIGIFPSLYTFFFSFKKNVAKWISVGFCLLNYLAHDDSISLFLYSCFCNGLILSKEMSIMFIITMNPIILCLFRNKCYSLW